MAELLLENKDIGKRVRFNIEKIVDVICKLFELGNVEIEHKKTKEYFFKKQRKIKPYNSHRIFSVECYSVNEELCDDKGYILCNLFKEPSLKKRGKVTYQYCRDNNFKNYSLLEVRLNRINYLGDEIPLRVIIEHPYSEEEIKVSITDKHYNQRDTLTNELEILLHDEDIFRSV